MPPTNPPPLALHYRSNTLFIIATVAIGLFTDLFLYGLIVPVLPFMLRNRLSIPEPEIQSYVSNLLAAYAGASVLSSVPAGWIADRTTSRQAPFLSGLAALLAATVMLAFGRSIGVLFAARVLQGVSAAVVWTIGLAMIMDTVGPANLGKVVGSVFSFISVGELMAPVIGGVLYEKTGYSGVFGVAAGVLGLDFVMRLLVVEKKTAAKYDASLAVSDGGDEDRGAGPRGDDAGDRDEEAPTENDALLPNKNENSRYKINSPPNRLTRTLPILLCFRNPRLLVGFSLAFVQASLLAVFDATIPTEASSLFGFASLDAGLLFIALDIPYLILGPVAGWAVDQYGTKFASVLGFGYLVPTLILLRLPSDHPLSGGSNVVLYCALLALNGVGLAVIGSPSVVETSYVVQEYDRANPGLFGANGPYAQLYGFNSLFFCAGLTVGPVVAGALRDGIGYGNMNLVFAIVSGLTAIASLFVIGGKLQGNFRLWRKGRVN
ncbi:MFS transporter-like protein [Annulohypoxylon maeteangense]|uniref:MFS transporter-like protein n=1 Tax=Annulohypoxylon maeteangense TaxID=1927788 RepID=UPI0020078CA2|nr:MFS transporter-like protein [Annulohypoxylon maeteangense]KAI0886587.1 MFS transporter-like protein [Annulohypoxylon maeteangense]